MEDEEEPEEEDDDDQAKVEDEDASATEEWESEGEHEGVGADDGAQSFLSRRLPRRRTMTILTRWRMRKRLPPRKEVDNETYFGYDPDREVDVWVEYQAAMHDPMFAY